MRALYSGVSGIRAHQTRMDVIGNNIANVNTVGFKASRVTFTDVFNQTLSSGSALTNPQQIGLGVRVGSTDLLTDPGSFQMTGRNLDLAISGEGFFILQSADGQRVYTRAGAFDWSADGYLYSPSTGMKVQGWMAVDGKIQQTDEGSLSDIRLIRGDVSLPEATKNASFKGNLNAAAKDGDTYVTLFTAYDSLGRPLEISVRFTRVNDGTNDYWKVEYSHKYTGTDSNGEPVWVDAVVPSDGSTTFTLKFNSQGKIYIDPTTNEEDQYLAVIQADDGNGGLDGAEPLSITVDFRAVTQAFDAAAEEGQIGSVEINTIDGRRMGTLEEVFVNELGVIIGRYSNGASRILAQIALANFNNPAGLIKMGNNTFAESPASGVAQVGAPGTGGRGTLVPGNLEGSNVDLAQQFTEMILTQRGYQASARLVSTADDMLQEIVNLKR